MNSFCGLRIFLYCTLHALGSRGFGTKLCIPAPLGALLTLCYIRRRDVDRSRGSGEEVKEQTSSDIK